MPSPLPTGTRKEVLPNGVQTVIFGNGDVKQTGLDRRVVYYYAEAATTHVSEPDGTQLYHFPNGQVERHFTDGLKDSVHGWYSQGYHSRRASRKRDGQ